MGFEFIQTTGKLVVSRVFAPNLLEEVPRFFAGIIAEAKKIPGNKFVSFVDVREVNLLPPHVANGYIAGMRADNAAVIRAALLINGDTLFGQQAERVLREAGNPSRRAFTATADVIQFLADTLTPVENATLTRYLRGERR